MAENGKLIPLHPIAPPKHKKERGRRHDSHDEEGGEEHGDGNWIVSYADMMTLLCVFFVLMYSMASPDPKKVEQMKKETTKAFGGKYNQPYSKLVDRFKKVIKDAGLEKSVEVDSDESGVDITFRGTFFFESGQTDIQPAGAKIMKELGGVIHTEAPGFKIVVEGHTDDTPIVSQNFPSNWELSGGRASRVIRMFEEMGFDRKFLTAIGYSDTRPLVPNRDEAGNVIAANQAQNRRVVLRVMQNGLGSAKSTRQEAAAPTPPSAEGASSETPPPPAAPAGE